MSNIKQSVTGIFVVALLLAACGQPGSTNNAPAADNGTPAISTAKRLFINNCVQCHSIKEDKLGPKLEGVLDRWHNDTAKVMAFIKNSQQVIADSKDPYVTKLYHDWSQAQMPPFPKLSDGEIKDIISYIGKGVE